MSVQTSSWAFLKKSYELGYHKMLIPEAFGGMGLTPLQVHIVMEEMGWGSFGLAVQLAVCSFVPYTAAFKRISLGDSPVRLAQADLPDDLGRFLESTLPTSDPALPVVIYNTWMTSYLKDKGQSMVYHIDQWAARQKRPAEVLNWGSSSG